MYSKREWDRADYERWHRYGHERGWLDKLSDEVRSWFGDDEAERRRRHDEQERERDRERDRYGRSEYSPRSTRWDETESRYGYGTRFSGDSGRESMYGREGRSSLTGREYTSYGYAGRGDLYDEPSWRRPEWMSERFNPYGSSRSDWTSRSEYGYGSTYPHRSESFMGRGPKNYQRNDERIKDDVHERLSRHPEVDAFDIEIDVQNGEVILRGVVESRREKRLAEDIAEDTFGVRNVQNMIRVNQPGMREAVEGTQTATTRPTATRR